jgi:Phage ABA sandwich domain
MAQTTSCRFCGYNIDVEIALLNTGRPDVCDNCAIEKRSEVKEQQIIETLATKVMEWRQVNLGISIAWVDSEGRDISAQVDSWDPLQNIADAWQVVEKFKAMRDTNYEAYRAFYEYVPESIYSITPEAICNAALKVIA